MPQVYFQIQQNVTRPPLPEHTYAPSSPKRLLVKTTKISNTPDEIHRINTLLENNNMAEMVKISTPHDLATMEALQFSVEIFRDNLMKIQPTSNEIEKRIDTMIKLKAKESGILTSIYNYKKESNLIAEFKEEHFPHLHNESCKILGFSLIHNYFCEKYGVPTVPFINPLFDGNSIMNSAKKNNSLQGEILEIDTLVKIGTEYGYNVTVLKSDSLEDYKKNICQPYGKKAVMAFYCTNFIDSYLIETNEMMYETCEHATVISDYNTYTEEVTLNHWGKAHPNISVDSLYHSSELLPSTRKPEYYTKNQTKSTPTENIHATALEKRRANYDYNSIPDITRVPSTSKGIPGLLTTITPEQGSGFKGMLIFFEPNLNHTLWKKINTEGPDQMTKTFFNANNRKSLPEETSYYFRSFCISAK